MGIRWQGPRPGSVRRWEAEIAFWSETIGWLERHPEIPKQKIKLREAKRALRRARGEHR